MPTKTMGKFMVQQVVHAETKGGKKYMRLKLLEPGGKCWNAMFWEDREDLKSGTIVDVLSEPDEYNGEPQLKIHALRDLPMEDPEAFLPHSPYDTAVMLAELRGYVEGMTDVKLKLLLQKALEDVRWKRSAAATQLHHAYLGGLLEHTLNLARLVNAIAALYPRLRRDLLLTGAILHDIGKQDEIASGLNIEYTVEGNLLGHIYIGMVRTEAWMKELEFDEERRRLVLHLIGSHHGTQQYGAIKAPLVLEAQVLCDVDGIDAHIGSITAVIDKSGINELWSGKVKWETRYYLGKIE